jgi:tRNA pseudouridine55 synthase
VFRLSPSADRRSTMKVGHTGTLDPLASGVLPLVIGKATRLAQFLTASEKEYEAEIELGIGTTTFDRGGSVVKREYPRTVQDLTRPMVEEAVAAFRGTYRQHPPAFSAKKVDGDRAYDLARKNSPVHLEAVEVTALALDVIEWQGARLRVRLVSSAGFYVRSLAESLGERLGTGAHLSALTRTRSGDFTLGNAVGLDLVDRSPTDAAAKAIPLDRLLPSLPKVVLTPQGAAFAARGGFIRQVHLASASTLPAEGKVRLFHPDGHLIAIAGRRGHGAGAFLHPGIVLE